MAQKYVIVVMLCLVILAGVLVLVFSQGSCPSTNACLQIHECYDRHKEHNSLKDIMLFGCSDKAGWVCCPMVPVRTNMAMTTNVALDNYRLLPMQDCGHISVNKITGGQLAAFGQFPWMALLAFKINGTGPVEFLCGGTLISKRYILTAAHCVAAQHGPPISVRLGEADLSMDEDCDDYCADKPVDFQVDKVIVHESYNQPYLKNDIALIRLNQSAPRTDYIGPICMPFGLNITGEEENKKYSIAGWGKVEDSSTKGSDNLLFTSVSNIPVSECNEVQQPVVKPINELQLCASGRAGNDACKGDSGGPLMETLPEPNGTSKTFQVGIVSFGATSCGGPVPSVYTRVDPYLNWIVSKLEP